MPDLKYYIDLLKKGDIVAFPTETVYGLGADAWNPNAIKKIFRTKGRPSDNPLIVHISNEDQLTQFVNSIPETAEKLIHAFWPGPITIVLNKKPDVLDMITAGLDTVALRMPDHEVALSLIDGSGPLVAPSANRSGKPSPTKAEHVLEDFGPNFPVLDGGATTVGLESTVIDLSAEIPTILRPGKIGKDEIEHVLGVGVRFSTNEKDLIPKSPGQKYSHYKPEAEVVYQLPNEFMDTTLYLMQQPSTKNSPNIILYDGNLQLMSRELYDRFRQADHESYSRIVIAPIEDLESSSPAYYKALINRIHKATNK